MLREMVRGVCAQLSPIDTVRELEDDATGVARELWEQFGELGICGLMLPEEYGGSAMSLLEGVVLYEELGVLAPVPPFCQLRVVRRGDSRVGSGEQHASLLTGIATGETIITPAWLEPDGGYSPKGVQLSAAVDGSDFVLNGPKCTSTSLAPPISCWYWPAPAPPIPRSTCSCPHRTEGLTLDQRMSISAHPIPSRLQRRSASPQQTG